MLLRIKRPGDKHWHFGLANELRPLCACGCNSPGVPRKRGDTLCKCFCHTRGLRRTKAICGKDSGVASWTVVVGRDRGCMECNVKGAELTKKMVEERVKER
jgi:hypothetical protein